MIIDFAAFDQPQHRTPEEQIWYAAFYQLFLDCQNPRYQNSAHSFLMSSHCESLATLLGLNVMALRERLVPHSIRAELEAKRTVPIAVNGLFKQEKPKTRFRRVNQERVVKSMPKVPIIAPQMPVLTAFGASGPTGISEAIREALALSIDQCEDALLALWESSSLEQLEQQMEHQS